MYIIVGHKDSDIDNFMPHLDPYLSPHIVNLTYADYSTVVSYYSSVSLVIGMRGHSQMIPLVLAFPLYLLLVMIS